MHESLRKLSPSKTPALLPEVLKSPSQTFAPKFLNRSRPKVVREESPYKWDLIKPINNKSKSPIRSVTPKIEKKTISKSYTRLEVQKKNPLSIVPRKDKKFTYLLEEIIQERTGKVLRDKYIN